MFSDKDSVIIDADREQAIYKAIEMANASDVILVAGKGHEDYQDIQGEKRPFSDKACILSALQNSTKNLNGSQH